MKFHKFDLKDNYTIKISKDESKDILNQLDSIISHVDLLDENFLEMNKAFTDLWNGLKNLND
jgi:hypothetical protein